MIARRAYVVLVVAIGIPAAFAYGLVLWLFAWMHPRAGGTVGAWRWARHSAGEPLGFLVDALTVKRGDE